MNDKSILTVGEIVAFSDGSKNARGYPLTGKIESIQDDATYTVVAFGLAGPGSETTIHGVPETALVKA